MFILFLFLRSKEILIWGDTYGTSRYWSKAEDHIAVMTLNRKEAANAMSKQLLDDLNIAIQEVAQDNSIYCAILTGAGEKAFCAGADLKERKTMTDEQVTEAVRYIGNTVSALEKMPKPVIAALNGAAYGGGLELALGLRFANSSERNKARFNRNLISHYSWCRRYLSDCRGSSESAWQKS